MVDWPEESAKKAILQVPFEWLEEDLANSTSAASEQCFFQFDPIEKVLKLVSTEVGSRIIDILDPEDIIGGLVEEKDDDVKEKKTKTILTLHAYPRRDPSHEIGDVIFQHCFSGIDYIHPKPHPNYKRPTDVQRIKYGHRYPFHRSFTVANDVDKIHVETLLNAILQVAGLDNNINRGRTLVVVNPAAGPKRDAADVYESLVQIMLEQAGIQCDVCITKYPQYAQERMMIGFHDKNSDEDGNNNNECLDILEYKSILCVGGDGIAHEIFQGIHARDDSQQVLQNITFGFIGAGTSNGMAKSIAYASYERSSVMDATFLIAKGHTRQCDLSLYHTKSKSYWSFLTFSWAMLADIDIDSEVLRQLGSLRFDIWGLWRVLKLKKYRAKFSYLPKQDAQSSNMPALDQPLPSNDNWVSMEDDFILFWTSHVTHAAENTFNSPMSRLDDGVFQILVVRYVAECPVTIDEVKSTLTLFD